MQDFGLILKKKEDGRKTNKKMQQQQPQQRTSTRKGLDIGMLLISKSYYDPCASHYTIVISEKLNNIFC